ncbi:MAG: hypothetical protein K5695_02350 [Oscillospiraceae bacterium]|nr:hypothetical protein [Oscillospiraceae bacterium]
MEGNRNAPAELERAITADRKISLVLHLCTLLIASATLFATVAFAPTSVGQLLFALFLFILSLSSFILLLISIGRLSAWLLVGRQKLRENGTTRIPYPDPAQRRYQILRTALFMLGFQAGLNGLTALVIRERETIIAELLYLILIVPFAILYRRSKKQIVFLNTSVASEPAPPPTKKDLSKGKHFFIGFLIAFILSTVALIVCICLNRMDNIVPLIEFVPITGFMTFFPLFRRRITNADYGKLFEAMSDD